MLALVVAFIVAQASPGSPLTGHWDGFMHRGAAKLTISFDFPQESPAAGFFSAPDIGAIDVPLARVTSGPSVHWELVGDVTTTVFDGTIAGNSMRGTFREGKRGGTFEVERVSTSTSKPYVAQDVSFADGSLLLAGTVFSPRAAGRHPAIVLVAGSGPEGRWAMLYIADYLARQGIVTLAYDKRGVGKSQGDWRTATMQDLAADASAGVDLLAKRDDVDPHNVGVYGHSQGAEIAPAIVANDSTVAWIAAADGPVGPQYRQDLYRVDAALTQSYSGEDLKAAEQLYAEFVDVARSGAPHTQLRADVQKAGHAPWLDDLGIPDDNSWIWEWYKQVGNYDNSSAWAMVNIPVLLLYGSNDRLVPPQESAAQIVEILKAHHNPPTVVRIFQGADHTLRIPPATGDGWPRNAPGFPDVLVPFAQGTLRS